MVISEKIKHCKEAQFWVLIMAMLISDNDDKEEDFILSLKRKSSNISLKFKQPNLTGFSFKFISYFRKTKNKNKNLGNGGSY